MTTKLGPIPKNPSKRSAPGLELPLAPLPTHRYVQDPGWQELWRRHERITTPLRARGLECDIQYGLSAYILHVALPDGSFLIIAPPQETGSDRPAGDPEGWIVTHHQDDQAPYEVIYDSTSSPDSTAPERPEARNGGSAWRMIRALDQHLARLGLLARPAVSPPRQNNTLPTASPNPVPAHSLGR
ncbi:hypothetical protein ACQPZG_31765 [Streptomyces sp. CA-294286]|uniref:hypothetical protein n=1 Tax=Streptomyces sp. CA-294286 TaxID=3240070 RepID=UPI003D8C93EA